MGFIFAQGPEDWRARIQGGVRELVAGASLSEAALASSVAGAPMYEAALASRQVAGSDLLPRFRLTCREVVAAGVPAAKLAGWRILLFAGAAPLAAVDFAEESGVLEVDGCKTGEALQPFIHALEVAERIAVQRNYEIRLLESPGLLFAAVWLRRAGEDLLIPLVNEGSLRALEPVALAAGERVLREKGTLQLAVQERFRAMNG